ncbi:MAG: S-layer homology domain-containing protein [Clostridia bacterium]|nr:S-layer homology domain-containing protein [Clostridia bacterium]
MKRISLMLVCFIIASSITAFAEPLMPAGQPFHGVLGLSDMADIGYGVIVRKDGKCADIETQDLQDWLCRYWDFAPFERVVAPIDAYVYDDYYIKLRTKDRTQSFIVYSNSGVIVGSYGEHCESHGETKRNYLWYLPYIGNGRNALYMANNTLFMKYLYEKSEQFVDVLRDVTPDDAIVLPEENLLMIDGASDWAKPEIQRAAACNLLPYELTERYAEEITRKEFCDLVYRLIATEFSPNSDSRMGQWSAIENVIDERRMTDKVHSAAFSDCEDDKIKFLSGAGIIQGMGDGTFAPETPITREQAATMLYRTAEFLRNKTMIKPKNTQMYADESAISDWAKSSVAAMKAMGIMQGVSPTEFEPQGEYTVEQAIATMVRLYECY